MKNPAGRVIPALLLLAALAVSAPPAALASDHADPTDLTDPNANITGLFIFPKGDQYILIFNVRRSLTAPKPYDLSPYEYVVNIDLSTPVTFNSAEDRARYGGTIVTPEKLHPDATITVRLNNDTTLKGIKFQGLANTDHIRTYTGVRDDPFVFPRFFKVNVISMVMSIPMNAFPAGQRDFILWGVTTKNGQISDHVGRSVRTQLPRFSAINTAPPREHVKILTKLKTSTDDLFNFLKGNKEWWSKATADLLQFTFQIRKYDLVPDVMIYTNRFPPGFPNGRLLTDDVNAIVCSVGDCLLQELSFIEGDWPRATKNDKDFLPDWPYLAEPWADKQEAAPSTRSILPYIIGIGLVLAFLIWGAIELLRRLAMWIWRKFFRTRQVTANG
jgi:hypothetical protein